VVYFKDGEAVSGSDEIPDAQLEEIVVQ